MSRMLEYEEEMKLSDRIVERRSVLAKVGSRKPTKNQVALIEDGDRAIMELVQAYSPGISARARAIWHAAGGPRASVDLDDLVNEAMIAAMVTARSFSCREVNGRPGVRFMRYAGLAIDKAVKRHLAKMRTPFRLDVQVIQLTLAWKAARSELKDKLGREPTDAEVEYATDIAADCVIPSLPSRSEFGDVDDPDSFDSPGIAQTIRLIGEIREASILLEQVLREVLSTECVDVLMSYFGVDRQYPRSAREVSEYLNIKPSLVIEYLEIGQNALMHPAYRSKLRDALLALEAPAELLLAAAGGAR